MTSCLQPPDQGIIRDFKARYHKHLLGSVIAKIDTCRSASEVAKSVTVLDAVYMISRAWGETTESTITKCFVKAGFPAPGTSDESTDDNEEDRVCEEVATLIREGNQSSGIADVDANLYIGFDDSMPTEETYTGDWERQLVDNFIADRENRDPDDDYDADKVPLSKDNDIEENLSYADALEMLLKLRNFATNKDCRILHQIQEAESVVEAAIVMQRSQAKQSTLDSWFCKK
ncbi:tigger transposable element-derived protein 6-like [Ptychodera flava]|uniref:tigger transposable element-derived protein 6-like n=1 Tax=Ptychodera flava TaxID=63121 RepID=UPI003969BD13